LGAQELLSANDLRAFFGGFLDQLHLFCEVCVGVGGACHLGQADVHDAVAGLGLSLFHFI
jgi:hypothetical protein